MRNEELGIRNEELGIRNGELGMRNGVRRGNGVSRRIISY